MQDVLLPDLHALTPDSVQRTAEENPTKLFPVVPTCYAGERHSMSPTSTQALLYASALLRPETG